MTSRDFCYWLQGYLELDGIDRNKGADQLSREQTECLKNHLSMVFKHEIDPSFGDKKKQEDLSKIHMGGIASALNC